MSRDKMLVAAKAAFEEAYSKLTDEKAKAIARAQLDRIYKLWDENTEVFNAMKESTKKTDRQ